MTPRSDVTVNYTGRSSPCTLPITVSEPSTGIKQINIPDNSNAFGAKYVQTSEPTGSSVCDGDVWYDTTSSSSPDNTGGFVTGMIMMFSGTTAPTGWALCNGGNGTPDLRDRFIVGAGSGYAVAATGGSADAVVVSHTHGMSHTHGSGTLAGDSKSVINSTKVFQYGGDAVAAHGYTNSNTSISGDTAASSISSTGAATSGVTGTNKNLPPYYALAFIMKT